MKIRVLGCHGAKIPGYHTSCMLIDDTLLLDAGNITAALGFDEQAAIDNILLTHAHLDHIIDLAFLADNVFTMRAKPVRIWGPAEVLDAVRRHIFNDEIWPDFSRIVAGDAPIFEFCPLPEDGSGVVGPYRVRWVRTNHPVFNAGYCLNDGAVSVLFSGDTAQTDALWAMGKGCPSLALAFVESSFPNRLQALAMASGHLTPHMLAGELVKFGRPEVPVKIFHMKPQFLDEIARELYALDYPALEMLKGGEEFTI